MAILYSYLDILGVLMGQTPTSSTCPNNFSIPMDQDICTQCALSRKKVVSEYRSRIAVSLNIGGGSRFIKLLKLYMCPQNTTNTLRKDPWHQVWAAMVLYPRATLGTLLRELNYSNNCWCSNSDNKVSQMAQRKGIHSCTHLE